MERKTRGKSRGWKKIKKWSPRQLASLGILTVEVDGMGVQSKGSEPHRGWGLGKMAWHLGLGSQGRKELKPEFALQT